MTAPGLYRRPRRPLAPEALAQPHGLPLICVPCKMKGQFYGKLKLPGEKADPCQNCGKPLTRAKPRLAKPHPAGP